MKTSTLHWAETAVAKHHYCVYVVNRTFEKLLLYTFSGILTVLVRDMRGETLLTEISTITSADMHPLMNIQYSA